MSATPAHPAGPGVHLMLVGIGAGNPEHLTLQAVRALNRADMVLIPRKGAEKAELAALRRQICDEVIRPPGPAMVPFDMPRRDPDPDDYIAEVARWHDAIARAWAEAVAGAAGQARTGRADAPARALRVALLVWGDPSLYDSTLRIADRLGRRPPAGLPGWPEGPVTVEVIPGITSIQALTASHAIPLNAVGGAVVITTGRRLRTEGWPEGAERVVVMLDAGLAFESLTERDMHIWWTAYAGMDGQIAIEGPLQEAAPRIRAAREEARKARGWIFDIYLLERGRTGRRAASAAAGDSAGATGAADGRERRE